jgi:hypothetical protein
MDYYSWVQVFQIYIMIRLQMWWWSTEKEPCTREQSGAKGGWNLHISFKSHVAAYDLRWENIQGAPKNMSGISYLFIKQYCSVTANGLPTDHHIIL